MIDSNSIKFGFLKMFVVKVWHNHTNYALVLAELNYD